jgi:class 3 adenylate cyclase
MTSPAIIDLDIDPRARRADRRKAALRTGLPVACILGIATALVLSVLHLQSVSREGATALSRDLLVALAERVESEVGAYVAPAIQGARGLAAALPDDPMSAEGQAIARRTATALMTHAPQVAAVSLGLPDGRFFMTRRRPGGEIDTRTLADPGHGSRTAVWRRDIQGKTAANTEIEPGDTYDPTTRPWYRGAAAAEGDYWTDLYVFFSDRAPGLTLGVPVQGPNDALKAVIGVDVRLGALSEFLSSLRGRARGYVLIVDDHGQIVASADGTTARTNADGSIALASVADLGDGTLSELYDRLRVEGRAQHLLTVDGTVYVALAPSLSGVFGRPWTLLFLAPEDAFVGFVAHGSRTALMLSSIVIALALMLAGVLLWLAAIARGRRAETETLRKRLEAEAETLAELLDAAASALDTPDALARRLTTLLTSKGAARRASVWRMNTADSDLWLLDAHAGVATAEAGGVHLRRSTCPAYFETLTSDTPVDAPDAAADPRTQDLWTQFLSRVDTRGVYSVPLRANAEVMGVLWLEDPASDTVTAGWGRRLARCAAAVLTAALAADTARRATPEQERPPAPDVRMASSADMVGTVPFAASQLPAVSSKSLRSARLDTRQGRRWLKALHDREQSGGAVAAEIFPRVTVLAIRLGDPLTLAETAEDDVLFARLMTDLRQAADTHGVPYVKVLTNTAIVADGLDGGPGAAARVARLALDLRDSWLDLVRRMDHGVTATFGMDTGIAAGAPMGPGDAPYNLWGEAVEVALSLAETAPAASVWVTETVADALADAFILVPRGPYYTAPAGELALFDLKEHL